MARIKLDGFRCERCGHEWVPRRRPPYRETPKTCPRCKSAYWDEPRLTNESDEDSGST